jgi:hypothetical protein
MTPRQFHLLRERRREELAHRELVAGWTTAAVINHSMAPPEEPALPLDFMPHHKMSMPKREQTEEELQEEHDFNLRALEMGARMKAAAKDREKTDGRG